MNIRRIAALVWGLIVIVASNTIVMMPTASANSSAQSEVRFTSQQQQIVAQLKTANVIYLGETHDRPIDRQHQLSIIQALFQHNPQVAIGMEMFQRPAQPLLDRYLAGKITAAELRVQSEFDKRWGYKWEDYAPILEFAKANRLPVIALNTPTEITRKAAREGLESLTAAERQWIPPLTEIDRSNAKYQQMILGSYRQHAGIVSISSKSFDRFYNAQLLWDETMAERVANFVKQNPRYQKVVIAGSSHIIYGYGIPDRVLRRVGGSKFTQKTVLLSLDRDLLTSPKPADFIWETANN
ncbi:ChaN family lipoprotein [Chamaesiphon polymorphus]|uniref:Iron-regulated protein n=1 Tax=Chamaesiphon polymorphus CCALA 037 TaxID=2107692 RepID=A0A2T1GJM9_9CYAN|nr:ChaN family lipoprotein [Chamaesiphon polymorphus]PSB58014.1 iron-regulated protein [Chamaesiphon polymorphus CCALA 037]